jgi:hypothetical protein
LFVAALRGLPGVSKLVAPNKYLIENKTRHELLWMVIHLHQKLKTRMSIKRNNRQRQTADQVIKPGPAG